MIEQRQEKFHQLSSRAIEWLEHPSINIPHQTLRLRLWHYPSHYSHAAWFIYTPVPRYQECEVPLVYERVWDYPFDAQRFREPMKGLKHGFSPEPTVSSKQTKISAEALALRLASLEKVVIPTYVDDGVVGVDGERCGVETYDFSSSVCLSWWGDGPETWQPIVEWAAEMRQFLKAYLQGEPTKT